MNKVLNNPASWKQTPESRQQEKNLYCFSDTLSTMKGALEGANHYFISSSFQDQDNKSIWKTNKTQQHFPSPHQVKSTNKQNKINNCIAYNLTCQTKALLAFNEALVDSQMKLH